MSLIFWRWEYCRRGIVGKAYLHFYFKKYNTLLPLSSHTPPGRSRTLIFLWRGIQAPCCLQSRALHQQRGAELSPSPSNRVLKSCLATRLSASGRPSPGRLPGETSFQSEIFYLNISYSVQIAGKEGSRQNESKETAEEEWEIKEGCQGSEWARIQGKIRE